MKRMFATAWVGGLMAWLALGTASAADAAASAPRPSTASPVAEQAAEPATLRLMNRDVLTMRASLLGVTPQVRAERARERIRALPESAFDEPLTIVPATLGDAKGMQFLLGDQPLFAVLEGDVDIEAKQSFPDLVKQTQTRVEEVRAAWHDSFDGKLLLQGALRTIAATLLLGILTWIVYRVTRRAVDWMEKKRDVLAARFPYVDWREFLARLAVGTMQLVQWFVLIVLAFVWLRFVLASFTATVPIANSLLNWLWGKLGWLADGVLTSLPGLVTVAIVVVFTRAVVDVIGYFFDTVSRGRLQLPMLHPETVTATRRIVTLVALGSGPGHRLSLPARLEQRGLQGDIRSCSA